MAAIAYTVAATFTNAALAEDWLRWLRDRHIADVLAGGASDAEIVELEGPERSFEIRYHFASRERSIAICGMTRRACAPRGWNGSPWRRGSPIAVPSAS